MSAEPHDGQPLPPVFLPNDDEELGRALYVVRQSEMLRHPGDVDVLAFRADWDRMHSSRRAVWVERARLLRLALSLDG